MLCLQTKSGAMTVQDPAFSMNRSIEKVARIKLDSGFGGEHFQYSSTGRFKDLGRKLQTGASAIQDPIVIVAFAKL